MDTSKEMIEIGGVPVIESLVRRMEVGGCVAIRVVTRPEKTDVRCYVAARGLEAVLAHPVHLGASIAAGLPSSEDETVALGFPDSLWEPIDGFARLRDELHGETDVVLGLFQFGDPTRADVVTHDHADGLVHAIVVKPSNPTSSLIWGCLVAHASALCGVERVEWPSEHLTRAVAAGRVRACVLSDDYVDIGTPDALRAARAALGT